jgi:hypothetical protein
MYTAVAVLQLYEQRHLDLYEPVQSYLPHLRLDNPHGERPITPYDLLTYRSGLWRDTLEGTLGDDVPTLDEYLRAGLEARYAPEYSGTRTRWGGKVGEDYRYSTFGIAILGRLVEAANPESLTFADYAARHILEPLQMTSSRIAPAPRKRENAKGTEPHLSTGYARFGSALIPGPVISTPAYPAAGMLTTPSDHNKLLSALLRSYSGQESGVVSNSMAIRMLTPQVSVREGTMPGDTFAGLGTFLSKAGASWSLWHPGSYPWGWWVESRAYPDMDLVVSCFANCWDMLRWHNPSERSAPGIVSDFVVSHLGGRPRKASTRRSWSWKASYVMGLVLVERTKGLLNAKGDFPSDTIRQMSLCVRSWDGAAVGQDLWDMAAFERGMRDMLAVPMSVGDIRSFLASDDCEVSEHDFGLIANWLSGKAELPVPMSFWASQ